jgi:hypothetical protein
VQNVDPVFAAQLGQDPLFPIHVVATRPQRHLTKGIIGRNQFLIDGLIRE